MPPLSCRFQVNPFSFSLKISLLRTFEDGIPTEARQLVRAAAQAG